ncbi:hypothetical protein BDV96DRAFT_562891 [Lophiotrema nucula]|uniref:Zn(2)-C6 fungal-type domain-containing protein n=1 Tax=Lophiotrema nucula TaxID=690887 RepID=A0A6A5ZSW1_9PLEO|nr:hypothetical protein BDV96DRAFT_562891 [Lophiotrema nucula]
MLLPRTASVAAHDGCSESKAKRRRLRKGTHSCWECKRRKMRCTFDPLVDATVCNGCRRRGSQCVSQEVPEEDALAMANKDSHGGGPNRHPNESYAQYPGSSLDGGDVRTPPGVGVQVGLRSKDYSTSGTVTRYPHPRSGLTMPSEDGSWTRLDHGLSTNGIATPVSVSSEPSRHQNSYKSFFESRAIDHDSLQVANPDPTSPVRDENMALSRILHKSLPSQEDTERICKATLHPAVLAHELMTTPYTILDQTGLTLADSLLDIPEPTLHPVLISRYMLLLATFLRHLHPKHHKDIQRLSEPPRAIIRRLIDHVVRLVTTNDELLGSIEGLECVILESLFQANSGNLRRSWISCRRAMSIAQLMCLNRPHHQKQYKVLETRTRCHPELIWFRIVSLDRFLCLMLGVSQGTFDRSMASEEMLAKDTPLGCLERVHCIFASRILERNESKSTSQDSALTQTLDAELQRAARSLPSKWWLTPTLDPISIDSQALFWDTRRLFAQVLHYNLLNQLHLPYMIRSSSAEPKYEYSRITCVNASREIITRFIALHRFNKSAYSCRTIDFLTLMAAMTLLLAHLDSRSNEAQNFLAHQYYSDRAMIEQVQENMKEVNRLNSDALSQQSADLLQRLLDIEIETADGHTRSADRVSVHEVGEDTSVPEQDNDAATSVHIPYFGIIKISRKGISKQVLSPLVTHRQAHKFNTTSTKAPTSDTQVYFSRVSETSEASVTVPVSGGYGSVGSYGQAQAQSLTGTLSMPFMEQDGVPSTLPHTVSETYTSLSAPDPSWGYDVYPDLAAGSEDWAFQGVDLHFFESLMRGTENEGNENAG